MYRASALDPIKPALLLPEVVDESKWRRSNRICRSSAVAEPFADFPRGDASGKLYFRVTS